MALERMTTKLSRHLEARWLGQREGLRPRTRDALLLMCDRGPVTLTALSPLDEG